MTLNMCGCIDKLCKTELLKDIIKFQCPGVMFIQMKIKITKENITVSSRRTCFLFLIRDVEK